MGKNGTGKEDSLSTEKSSGQRSDQTMSFAMMELYFAVGLYKTSRSERKLPVRESFAINRSSFGAFDMVGIVWEWVADEVGASEAVSDADAESARRQGQRLRIVKGGSAEESFNDMDSQSRYEVPEVTKVKVIGFRYVVVAKKSQ